MPVIESLEGFGRFVDFGGRGMAAIPAACLLRMAACLRQFERVAWGSVPIILAAGFSVGLVTWMQTRRQLLRYGLESTLPSLLMVAVVVETGPILVGLLMAGRLGAGLAAELGSMTLTEEIDARVALGSSPMKTLVAPRLVACLLAAPLLTILIDVAALGGALIAEQAAGTLGVRTFAERALDLLTVRDALPATLKTAAFGLLVGLVGCWTGLTCERSAEAIGRAATLSVVRSILAVFAADVVLVPWIQAALAIAGSAP